MKHIITSFLFLFIGVQLIQGQITVKIIDSDTSAPLEYATAVLYSKLNKESITGVITDADGNITIEDIKKGRYYLEASFIGYDTKTINTVEVSNRNSLLSLGTIGLSIGKNQLDEVLVIGERAMVINKIDRQVFNAKAFQNTQGGSATDVIKNLPSVSVNGLGEISVRGSSGYVQNSHNLQCLLGLYTLQ